LENFSEVYQILSFKNFHFSFILGCKDIENNWITQKN